MVVWNDSAPADMKPFTDADTFDRAEPFADAPDARRFSVPYKNSGNGSNDDALSLVDESRKRDRLRRQEQKEKALGRIGGVLGWLLFLSLIVVAIHLLDGPGAWDAAVNFVSVWRGRGYH